MDQKRQCAVYSSTGREKGYTLTSIVSLGPTKKTGYPLSTTDSAILYLFVHDSNDSGKVIQTQARQVLNESEETESVPTQWGSGLKKGSTENVHMYGRR